MIITKGLILKVLDFVTPTVESILASENMTWGPKYINGYINVPGIEKHPFTFGEYEEWNPEWGEEKDFSLIAGKKADVAERLGGKTSNIVAMRPWLLKKGEFLYPGGNSRSGITVAVSGAIGWVDEFIATMILEAIIMLAQLETDKRKERKEMEI